MFTYESHPAQRLLTFKYYLSWSSTSLLSVIQSKLEGYVNLYPDIYLEMIWFSCVILKMMISLIILIKSSCGLHHIQENPEFFLFCFIFRPF